MNDEKNTLGDDRFNIISYDIIDSTNDFLIENHRKLRNLTVCWALEQRRGRGRKGRIWYSPKGGLWFSILFKPKFRVKDQGIYTKIASVSIYLSLEKMGIKDHIIKWPNDIYVKGKKIAGILTELITNSECCVIVGIGMNVQNNIPKELKDKAISLKDLVYDTPDIAKILNMILKRIWKFYNMLRKRSGQAIITKMWKKRIYPKEGQLINYIHNGDKKTGKIIKIHQNYLMIETENKLEKLFDVEIIL